MPVPALEADRLDLSYGKSPVLKTLHLSVAQGECFGLVGENGAGKTTLIKCLLDFAQPEGGTIRIFGVDHRRPEARSRLAFVPERFTPPYYLTGGDFLRYMLRLRGQSYDPEKVQDILAALDLDPSALAKPVRTHSKGMTQKLGLAACFLSERELFVLDEPMSGLDPKARALLKRHLQALKAAGRTVFFSSHTLADVAELCDRMAILHRGEVRYCGTPEDGCRSFGTPTLEEAFLDCIA